MGPLALGLLVFGTSAPAGGATQGSALKEGQPAASGSKSLTLAKCVQTALTRRPELRGEKAAVQVSAAHVDVERGGYFPTLTVSAGYERLKYSYTPKSGGKPPGEDRNDWVLSTNLDWSVLDVVSTSSRVDAAKAKKRSARESLKAKRRGVALEVTHAYYEALERRHYIVLLDAALERSKLHEKLAKARLDVGKGSQADILRARVTQARTQLELTKAKSAHTQALAGLKTAMGVSLSRNITPQPVGLKIPSKVFSPLKRKRRPEQRQSRHLLEASRHEKSAALHGFWPRLRLFGGVELQEDRFFPGENNWFFGVALEIPLFRYYRTTAEWRKAKARVAQAKAQVDEVDSKLALVAQRAFLKLKEAKATLNAAKTLLASAKKNLEVDEERYRQGVGSMVALTDARATFFTAKAEVVRAVFNALVRAADYRHATGREARP